MSFKVENINMQNLEWFVGTAGVRMLTEELKRPDLLDYEQLYLIANRMMLEGTGFIVKRDGECVGALGSILVPNIFNPKYRTLGEIFWYVLPEHRNTRAGILALIAFDNKAKEIADEATLSLLSSSKVNESTLAKRGYLLTELGFHKNFKGT